MYTIFLRIKKLSRSFYHCLLICEIISLKIKNFSQQYPRSPIITCLCVTTMITQISSFRLTHAPMHIHIRLCLRLPQFSHTDHTAQWLSCLVPVSSLSLQLYNMHLFIFSRHFRKNCHLGHKHLQTCRCNYKCWPEAGSKQVPQNR